VGKLIDMTGERVGKLIVVSKVKFEGDTRAYWACKCDCGNDLITSGKSLRYKGWTGKYL